MAPPQRREKGAVQITAMVTNVRGKVRSGYLPFRTNANTLPITPKRSSSRDVGTSSYRYHTATSDGETATAHTSRRTMDPIQTIFTPDRVVRRGQILTQSEDQRSL
ncbi:hypothetical protein TNCV_2850121 [Trichonephila clavipes]|nr:hypothetical protein TNCV_2850121 [Trichonephila clavipes]